MRGDCSIRIDGLGFSAQEIAACSKRSGLLSIEIELAAAGECQCPACQSGQSPRQKVLTVEQIHQLIAAAKEEGIRRCILVDSEPNSWPELLPLIDQIQRDKIQVELFTRGQGITAESAKKLFDIGANIVADVELDSPAFLHFKRAGFAGNRLAIQLSVNQANLNHIPSIWQRIRSEGGVPYVQIMTPNGAADRIPPNRAKQLFEELGQIDSQQFGRTWPTAPSLIGRSCKRHLFACHVTPCGAIFACVGVTIPLGNIQNESLRDILSLSEVLEHLRDFGTNVKEPCQTCSKSTDCYGCRGSAYQLTGDYLAGDQMCWKAEGVKIPSFPIGVDGLVPHGLPIRIVDQLIQIGERANHAELIIQQDSPFVDENGEMDELAYVEMIAQTFAAAHGFLLSASDRPMHCGLLLGIKDLRVTGRARKGDRLQILVRRVTKFGDFAVVEGTVTHEDGRVFAQGQIKVWQPGKEGAKAIFG